MSQTFEYRFVQLKDDLGATIDVMTDGESYFYLDPSSISHLIDVLTEARRAIRGLHVANELEHWNTTKNTDHETLGIREAYNVQSEANRLKKSAAVSEDAHEDSAPHDCLDENDFEFKATYGAPGVGQAWACKTCGKEWAKLGDHFFDPCDRAHELTINDVR